MPVYINKAHLPDGTLWAMILVRNDAASVKHHFSEIFTQPQQADKWITKTILKYWRTKLREYCNHREYALREVKALLPVHEKALMILKNDYSTVTHDAWFYKIILHQREIFALLPGQSSPHKNWRKIMQELMSYAYNTMPAGSEKEALNPHYLFSYIN